MQKWFCYAKNVLSGVKTKHSFETHSVEPTFSLVCGIRCLHLFKFGSTFSSFKTHISRKHPNWRTEINSYRASINLDATIQVQDDTFNGLPCPSDYLSSDDEEEMGESDKVRSVEETAALFLLTLKEKFKLTQRALDFALGSVNEIITGVCDSIKQSAQASAVTPLDLDTFEHYDPFSLLKTEYQQSKFYREHFGLVVSRDLSYNYYSCI